MHVFIASVWFDIGWFVAVIGAEQWQWGALAFAVATLLFHSGVQKKPLLPLLAIGALGWGIDYLNVSLSIFQFPSNALPIWLVSLWLMFAWYTYQLKSLLLRFAPVYVLLAGALGGSLSYFAGYQLGAVEFGYSVWLTMMILTLEWAIITLLIIEVHRRGEKNKTDLTGRAS